MTGPLSHRKRILRLVDESFVDDLEAFNRATHPDALREIQLEAGKALQLPDDAPAPVAPPAISLRLALTFAAFAAAIAIHHAVWSASL